MERFYRVCFICFLCILSFAGGFFTKNIYFYHLAKNLSEISGEIPKEAEKENTSFEEEASEQSIQAMNLNTEPEINANTEYYIYEYNSQSKEGNMVLSELPSSLDGADRKQVLAYLDSYVASPSLKDREKGLVSASIFEFSPEKVVIEKVYDHIDEAEEECFYLKAEENYVVVYCSDLRTVYQYTDIRYDKLPAATREKVDKIMKIDSLEELYSFLESHTS